jgi:hypothetical protein
MTDMLAAGATRQEISDALPGRTLHSVKSRITYNRTPWAELAEENRRKQRARVKPKYQRKTTRNHVVSELVNIVVPKAVIEERNLRCMAPRSLTAILMGDPEPGRVRL